MLRQKGRAVPVIVDDGKKMEDYSQPPQVAHFNLSKSIAKPFLPFNEKMDKVPLYCYQSGALQFEAENTDNFTLKAKKTPSMGNTITMSSLMEEVQIPSVPDILFDKGIKPFPRPLQ